MKEEQEVKSSRRKEDSDYDPDYNPAELQKQFSIFKTKELRPKRQFLGSWHLLSTCCDDEKDV